MLQELEQIDEAVPVNDLDTISKCEACDNDNAILQEEDLALNQDISKKLPDELNLQKAYNDFRKRKGLAIIDFKNLKSQPEEVQQEWLKM